MKEQTVRLGPREQQIVELLLQGCDNAEIASQLTKQPPERFGWIFSKNDYFRDPNLVPDLDALQRNVDMTRDLGFARGSLDVKAHSDLSLIKEAARRLK